MTDRDRWELDMGERTASLVIDRVWGEAPSDALYRQAVREVERVMERKADTAFFLLSPECTAPGEGSGENARDAGKAARMLGEKLGAGYRYYLSGRALRIFLFFPEDSSYRALQVRAKGMPEPGLRPCEEGSFRGGTGIFEAVFHCRETGKQTRMPVMMRLYVAERPGEDRRNRIPEQSGRESAPGMEFPAGVCAEGSVALVHGGREVGRGHLEFSGEKSGLREGDFFCELVF